MATATPSDEQEMRYRRLIELGIALSSERNHQLLQEKILLGAKDMTKADGGTLYLVDDTQAHLRFTIMLNDSLGIAMGGTTGKPIPLPPVDLYKADGSPNHANISAHAALTATTVAVADAYDVDDFDFSGTKAFDAKTGYRSQSFLTVPLKNHDDEVIGVLQLINARDDQGKVVAFPADIISLIEALASQAAIALENQMLLDAQKNLFKSFIDVLNGAIDAKSPYTGGHCRRVSELVVMLTRAGVAASTGPFADFSMTDDEWYELEVAGGLHDCGKVTTPEYVIDKSTKLETIYNRIHEIRTRFEVLKREAEISYLRGLIAGGNEASLRNERDRRMEQLDDDFAFVANCNTGGEFMAVEKIERLQRIAETPWMRTMDNTLGLSWEEAHRLPPVKPALPVEERLLADRPEHLIPHDRQPTATRDRWGFTIKVPDYKFNLGELYNLSITRGTLTAEERYHINDHVVRTIMMLDGLPFPKSLKQVPEWAGNHHEKLDGSGYPRGLAKEDLSLPARIMAISDVFEALTSCDRPYKTPKKLSECIEIMFLMKKDGHIDPDVFDLFLTSGVYREYAHKFLPPRQIDAVDISKYISSVTA